MSFLKSRHTPKFGIDISSSSVKLLELSEARKGYRVEAYAIVPLSTGAVQEKNIAEIEAVGDAVQEAISRAGTKTKEAVIAVPGSAAISKIVNLPAGLSDDEMEAQIQMEADQSIPYPLEEVNLDFEVLGPTQGNPNTVDVLLAASRSEHVERRVAAVELAKVKARIVDIEPFAVENAFQLLTPSLPDQGREQTIAVVDIGATMTDLSVFRDGRMIYTREHAFGGNQLTEEIMRRYQLNYQEAGKAKKTGAGLPDTYNEEVLNPFKENVTQQVTRFLQFFYSSSGFDQIDHIVVGGGTAAIPGLDDMVAESTGTSASTANPFANMKTGSRVPRQALANDAPSLLIACGLALRSFD